MIELLESIKKKENDLCDAYDLIHHDSRCNITKKDVEEAKNRVKVASSFIVKKEISKKLSDTNTRRYHSLLNRVLKEPNFKVLIMHMDNGLGIENILGGEKFYFEE